MSSSDKPSVVYGLGLSQVEKAAGHSLEEGKKLREQDPNITQIKGPDEETITPGNWPKTGRLRPLGDEEAARQKYLEQEARRRGEEYDELEAETKGGLPTHDSELYETERRALAEGDLRLKAGEQAFKHPHGPAVRALNKLEGRSEI